MKSELASEIEQERRDLTEATRRLELDSRELQRRQSEFKSAESLQYENNLREMESLRAEKLAEMDRREAEVTRREIDVEKRARFHEDHLDRVRGGIWPISVVTLNGNGSGNESGWSRSKNRSRLRLAHVRRYRDLVTQREQSIEQERELLQQAKANSDAEIAESRKLLQAQWQAFEQGRDANLAELSDVPPTWPSVRKPATSRHKRSKNSARLRSEPTRRSSSSE